jgi:TrmH family RNA methyltransferase
MGAHPLLDIAQAVPLERLMADARVPLCATSSHAGLSIVDANLSEPRIWLFGSEGAGLDPAAIDASRVQWLCIEQRPAMESLNVGVAASICLHEQFRQRRKPAMPRSV